MPRSILERVTLPAPPEAIYDTYMDADRHAEVIGATVSLIPAVGGSLLAFDGHVRGRFLLLSPGRMIVHEWGSDHFGDGHLVSLTLAPVADGTEVTLFHTGIPEELVGDVDWDGRYWRPWRELLRGRPAAQQSELAEPPDDMTTFNRRVIDEYRRTGGQLTGPLAGLPVLLLTTSGRRSGSPHVTPLGYVDDGDRLVVAATAGGAPTDPDWYRNLVATPTVTIECAGLTRTVTARTLDGVERDRLFARLCDALPGMADYALAAAREIPVVALG